MCLGDVMAVRAEDRMNILHVAPMYYPALGGAELHLKEVSQGLAARGHDVTVLTANVTRGADLCASRAGGLPSEEMIEGVRVVRLPPEGGWLGALFERWRTLKGGYRTLQLMFSPDECAMLLQGPRTFNVIPYLFRSHADIVMSMGWYWPPAFHVSLAHRLKPFALVGMPLFHLASDWCARSMYDSMLAQCDAVVTNTSFEADYVRAHGAKQAIVAGVGIHPAAFANPQGHSIRKRYGLSSHPVVGFVGRQAANKGADKVVAAMKTVWAWNQQARVVLAGPRVPGKWEDELLPSLTSEQRSRIIRIDEFEDKEKASIFAAFDVFVLPSIEESFGIAYLEAWMCGKPVIGSRIGSTACVINDREDGILADPHDPRDVGAKIIELLSDPDRRMRMGAQGRAKTLAHYTWDQVTTTVETVYRDALVRRGRLPAMTDRSDAQVEVARSASQ